MTAPVLTGFGPAVTFGENLVNATPQRLDTNVVFSDAEGNFDGGTLTLSGLLAEDRVSVRNAGGGGIGLSGADVVFGGVTIGTLTGGVGNTLSITFNAAATSAAIDALIQNLTYANVSNEPTASRTLVLNVTDAGGAVLNAQPAAFTEVTGAANPFDGVTVGSNSAPSFGDIDGDGDADLVLGERDGTIRTFTNNGAGVFTELTGASNPFNGVDAGLESTPFLADIDSNGSVDLALGAQDGTIRLFGGNGGGVFTELTGSSNPFDGVDVGLASAPSFVDINGDGQNDAVVGARSGTLHTFSNNGEQVFTELTGAENPFDGISLGTGGTPSFVDIDGDGDVDLVVGNGSGVLRTFANNGAAGFAELTGAANPFDGVAFGFGSAPSFVDIDGDGDMDAVVGAFAGTLRTFLNNAPRSTITVTVTSEQDPITGGPGDDSLDGTSGDDTVIGFAGNDTLNAGLGNDTMQGGAGNDLYIVDSAGDVVTEATTIGGTTDSGGLDTVESAVSFNLDANIGVSFIERLTLTGTGNINGTGNARGNLMIGNAGNNVLNGGTGRDTMLGGAGNDTYVVDDASDRVFETTTTASAIDAGGTDTVQSAVNFNLDANAGVRFVERLTLTGTGNTNGTGNALNNLLTGNAGNNVLNGGLGRDTMLGGAGNDTYVVDNASDRVFETTTTASAIDAGGIDTIVSSVNFNIDLTPGLRFVERLTLTGAAEIATGNALDNTLTGNAAFNVLNGGLGRDTMLGGAGNDLYIVDNASDRVFETTTTASTIDAGGTDTVQSFVNFNLDASVGLRFVEQLTLAGTAITGTGNALNNVLSGNASNNVLNGGLGNDTLRGYGGNDTLTGGTGNDTFVFNLAPAAGGVDMITDFAVVDDTIRLENSAFVGLALGNLAASAFTFNTAGTATDDLHRVIYETDNGRLYFDADGDGAGASVHFATLTANLALTNADFFVF